MEAKTSVSRHAAILRDLAVGNAFTVFLCGPTLTAAEERESAKLRARLIEELEAAGFEVVLGEDDGLESERLSFGLNAQDNELEFIRSQCNAIIILADSVGAFCELGLFSWHFVHDEGYFNGNGSGLPRPAFIVLVDKKYEKDKSYLNEGPVHSIMGYGDVRFVDYSSYDLKEIHKILKNKRSIQTLDRRGRPRGQK